MDKSIPAKLHLGDKMLKSDIIPPGISGIGDWAYAHCSCLKQLALPDTVCNLGKEVFLGCTQLNHVYCYSGEDFSFETLPAEKDAPAHQKAVLTVINYRHGINAALNFLPLPTKRGLILSWQAARKITVITMNSYLPI